jgi:hypothetical protein
MLDQAGHDTLTDKPPSLFHLIKQKKRREKRTTTDVQDGQGEESRTLRQFAGL